MSNVKHIGVCSVHNRFRSSSHRWLDQNEDYEDYIAQFDAVVTVEDPCDLCDNPRQLKVEFEEVKPTPEIIKYYHHDGIKSVQKHLKGKHREHNLCFQNCVHFKPNTPENCEIAQTCFTTCVKFGLVSPIWECPKYESEQDYKEAYDKILKGGMFWELHPDMQGVWEVDKQEFIDYHIK